jgi:PPK2 family polyphosphate:nucleotide phosphotransferase
MADSRTEMLAELIEPLRVAPGTKVSLPKDHDPSAKASFVRKKDAKDHLRAGVELLAEYQERLAAQDTTSLLVVLQAMDAAGKDGTIRHVMSGVNPQGVVVHSFKSPSPEELDHDFLWRCARRLPARGQIGIFNRSHYEEVLVVRVHPQYLDAQKLPPGARAGDLWKRRYRQINDWERHLAENGTRIVKLFLNVSPDEQRERFLARIDEPEKNWKFSAADIRERAFWDEYQRAYAELLSQTSTEWAPWYVVPADRKWFARLAVSAILVQTLADVDPQYPAVTEQARQELLRAKAELEAEPRRDDGAA